MLKDTEQTSLFQWD